MLLRFGGVMSETLAVVGGSSTLATAVDVTADIAPGGPNGVTVSLVGSGTWTTDFPCFVGDVRTADTATVEYRFDYTAQTSSGIPSAGGRTPFTVTMPLVVAGNISFTLTKPFTAECASLNSNDAPGIGPYGGSGELTVAFDGQQTVAVATSWNAPSGVVIGATNGTATLT